MEIDKNNPQASLFYEADISGMTMPTVSSQPLYGICSISEDMNNLIYEKRDLDFKGVDECNIHSTSCYITYQINFSDEDPALIETTMICD